MRGGKRRDAGRPRGAQNKRTEARERATRVAASAAEEFLRGTAFEGDAHFLLMLIYKDVRQPMAIRLDAAKAAIGYEKPRLQAIEATLGGNVAYTAVPIPVEERPSDVRTMAN
jgi:hypothetical protein